MRSRLTAGGRTVRRSLPGVMSWCDTTTCTRGTSASSSWPSEAVVSPYHSSKCKHLGDICLYFLPSVNPDPVIPFALETQPPVLMDPFKKNIDFKYYILLSPQMQMSVEVMNNFAFCGLQSLSEKLNCDFHRIRLDIFRISSTDNKSQQKTKTINM